MKALVNSAWFQLAVGLASLIGLGAVGVTLWDDIYPAGQFLFLITLIAVLSVLLIRGRRPDVVAREVDKRMMQDLLRVLPARGGAVGFLQHHPFDTSYHRDQISALYEFLDSWNNAEHTFHDYKIDAARRRLRERIAEFLDLEVTHVFSRRDSPNLMRVYPDVDLDWEDDDNRYALDAVRALNRKAREVYDAYQDLVATARRRLIM